MEGESNKAVPPVALVTGASRGIGRGIAIELARVGYSVAINYARQRDAALETQALCEGVTPSGTKACFAVFRADISRAGDRARLLTAVRRQFGWIDLLVNNAGVAPLVRADMLKGTEKSFDHSLNINLRGPYFLTQAVANFWIAGLKRRPGGKPRPKIVNVSSVSAYAPSIHRADYCMSKAALSMMTQLFAARLADYGICVYEIRPGIIATDMTAPVREKYDRLIAQGLTPLSRWGTPEDVALAVTAIAQDRFPFSTGEVLNVDGGFHIRRL
jgi:NAD(P)-dependent dehydrogenase (short-subunit alcohol dehydrogenase family)